MFARVDTRRNIDLRDDLVYTTELLNSEVSVNVPGVVHLNTGKDLIDTGNETHTCVGDYIEKIANSHYMLFRVDNEDGVSVIGFDVEAVLISEDCRVYTVYMEQHCGKYNQDPPESHLLIAKDILSELQALYNES